MSLLKSVQSFATGEVSPWIETRYDIAKYDGACRLVENFIVLPQGAAQKRPGMEKLAAAAAGATAGVLLPFQISTTEAVMLVLGGGKMQVRSTGIPSALVVPEIAIPWSDSQLRFVRWRQINSVLYLVHPDLPPRKLTRFAVDDYQLEEVDYSLKPALLPENVVEEHKITVSVAVPPLGSWSGAGVAYKAGQKVTYNGRTWRCQKNHTSTSTKPPGGANSTYLATVSSNGLLYNVFKPLWLQAADVDQSMPPETVVDLEATIDTWEAGHVGAIFEIAKKRHPTAYETRIKLSTNSAASPQTSDVIVIQGGWTFRTDGIWRGTFSVEKSEDNGATWEEVRTWFRDADGNVDTEGSEDTRVQMRIRWVKVEGSTTGIGADGASAILSSSDQKIRGLVRISEVSDARTAKAIVVTPVELTTTYSWSESAWNDVQGYPRCIELHQGRVVMASTRRKPHTIWGSASDDYENFYKGTGDADMSYAHTVAVAERDPILWLISDRHLLVGTGVSEFTVWGEDQEKAIVPEFGNSRRQSAFGSHNGGTPAVYTDSQTLFIQRGGTIVREFAYRYEADRFEGANLNILADHLFEETIESVAIQRLPWQIAWFVSGGKLFGLTYETKQEVVAWHRHTTQGTILSVGVVRGDDREDEVWLLVERDYGINIERFRPGHMAARPDDGWWMDGAVKLAPPYDFPAFASHLEGLEILGYCERRFCGRAVLERREVTLEDEGITLGGRPWTLGLEEAWPFTEVLDLRLFLQDPDDDTIVLVGGAFRLQGIRNGRQWFGRPGSEDLDYAQWVGSGWFIFLNGAPLLSSAEDVEKLQDVAEWAFVEGGYASAGYLLGDAGEEEDDPRGPLWLDRGLASIDFAPLEITACPFPELVGLQVPFLQFGPSGTPAFFLAANEDHGSVSIAWSALSGWVVNTAAAVWSGDGEAQSPWRVDAWAPLFGTTEAIELTPVAAAGDFDLVLGFEYQASLQPMTPEVPLQNGPSRSREWRWHRVVVSLRESRGGKLGETPEGSFDPLGVGSPAGLFTGEVEHDFAGGYSTSGDVCAASDEPYPFALRAMILKGNVYGDS